jgi:hypothetical protein
VSIAPQLGITGTHQTGNICNNSVYGSGSAWADADNDGLVDLFATNHLGANFFYHNLGDTDLDLLPNFVDVATALGIDDAIKVSIGSVFVDYDNDGDQDLYVTHYGSNTLYENQLIETGSLAFNDVTALAGIGGFGGRTMMSAWGDYDQDGNLDVYITRHDCPGGEDSVQDQLFHNNGDSTFTDVSGQLCPLGTAPCQDLLGLGFAPGWLDYDNDGDLDLYMANDNIRDMNEINKTWRNDGSDGVGGWIFTEVGATSGTDLAHGVNSMGLGVGDYNNDGWLDMAISDIGPAETLINNGDATFDLDSSDSDVGNITGGTTWAAVFFDYDNDGWLDLYLAQGAIRLTSLTSLASSNDFLKNDGDGTFSSYSTASGLNDFGTGRNASIVDINMDGFVDVFLNNLDTELRLYLNQEAALGNPNHWLVVTVEGTTSNRDGIGTRLTLVAGGLTKIWEINTGPTHGGGDQRAAFFGLGSETSGTLTVRWPDGTVQNIGTVNADQYLHLIEPLPPLRFNVWAPKPASFGWDRADIGHVRQTK